MKNPLLTIIVPAYNMERYLPQCLSSLEHQTLSNHKVIVVDDGSTDRTAEIAKSFADRLPDMFTYVYKENGGLGSARNVGIPYVTTEYMAFLDSDDWHPLIFVSKVTDLISSHRDPLDLIITLPVCYDAASKTYYEWMDAWVMREIFPNTRVVTSIQQTPRLNHIEANASRMVYHTSFAKEINLSFPEGTRWEDVAPRFHMLHHAKRCAGLLDAGFYYRTNRPGQITGLVDEARLEIFPVFKNALTQAKENNYDISEIAYMIHMLVQFSLWSLDFSTPTVQKQLVERLHILFKDMPKEYINAYYQHLWPAGDRKLFVKLIPVPVVYRLFGSPRTMAIGKKVYGKVRRMAKG